MIVLKGHEGILQDIAITPNGRWLVTGSFDRTARVWDLNLDSLIERARRFVGGN